MNEDVIFVDWKIQWAELWEEISAATTTQELTKIKRAIMKRYDRDELPSNSIGAILSFTKEMKEKLAVECVSLPTKESVQQARFDRILHTGARDRAGRSIARKF